MNDHDQLPQSTVSKSGSKFSQYSNISEKASNKKTLEQQQVVGPECSDVHHIQPNQQPGGSLMADTSHISHEPRNKSFAENTEQADIDSIEWKYYDDNICPQCGQNHGYKLTAGSTIHDMISFLDRDSSKET